MRGYLAVAVVVATAAAAAGFAFHPVSSGGQQLVVESLDGDVLLEEDVEDGEEVMLEYVHSVEKTEVREVYVVRDSSLVLNRTEYSSFGAGLHSGDVERTSDDVYVHRPDVEREHELVVATGEVAGHTLLVDGERYRLAEEAEDGSVRFTVTSG